jgi:signal transduction histidine kinase
MMPGSLLDLGLEEAIKDLTSKIELQTDLHVWASISLPPDDLTDVQKINIYRIIQEAINNTIKHAQATQIKVTIRQVEGELLLDIDDDGKGFNLREKDMPKGIGLKNINSRVSYLNGKIIIDSTPDQGTHFHISIPLD